MILITPGQVWTGFIDSEDDLDFFRFTVAETATYVIYTRGGSSTSGRLYGSAYNGIASDINQSGELENFRIQRELTPGIYYVEVGYDCCGVRGAYELHVAH